MVTPQDFVQRQKNQYSTMTLPDKLAFSAEACINGYETERRLTWGCDGSGK